MKPKPWKLAALVAGAIVLLVLGKWLGAAGWVRAALQWIASLGGWAPLIFVLVYVLACVFLLPGSVLTLGAGAVFGMVRGTFTASIAATLGATAAFLVGRYLARDRVAGWIAGDPRFLAIDEAVGREGWRIVGLTRLSPLFPFNLLNYAFGLTRVSLRDYVLASWIGMMPGTVLYVYLGTLAGDLARLGSGVPTRSTGGWVLFGAGLVATLLVTVQITRIARRALRMETQ